MIKLTYIFTYILIYPLHIFQEYVGTSERVIVGKYVHIMCGMYIYCSQRELLFTISGFVLDERLQRNPLQIVTKHGKIAVLNQKLIFTRL